MSPWSHSHSFEVQATGAHLVSQLYQAGKGPHILLPACTPTSDRPDSRCRNSFSPHSGQLIQIICFQFPLRKTVEFELLYGNNWNEMTYRSKSFHDLSKSLEKGGNKAIKCPSSRSREGEMRIRFPDRARNKDVSRNSLPGNLRFLNTSIGNLPRNDHLSPVTPD